MTDPHRVYAQVPTQFGRSAVDVVAPRRIVQPVQTGKPLVERVVTSGRTSLPVEAGETLFVEKLVTIYTSRDVEAGSVRQACLDELGRHLRTGFDSCRDRNRAAWAATWADCDIVIDGDADSDRAVRFSIHQLLMAANESDARVNIGANALTGERYRGHAFWDTEVFMLPFFIYTQP